MSEFNNLKLEIADISVLSAPFFQAIDFPEYKNRTAIATKAISTISTERQIIRLFLFISNGLCPSKKVHLVANVSDYGAKSTYSVQIY